MIVAFTPNRINFKLMSERALKPIKKDEPLATREWLVDHMTGLSVSPVFSYLPVPYSGRTSSAWRPPLVSGYLQSTHTLEHRESKTRRYTHRNGVEAASASLESAQSAVCQSKTM